MTKARSTRWLPQFSLRTILIVITLLCVAMGWPYSRAERQRLAVRELQKMNCYCEFEPEPQWLGRLPKSVREFRDGHYFRSITKVHVNRQARDSLPKIFEAISQIDRVETIDCNSAPVTYEHLARLSRLRRVKLLRLNHPRIDDGALATLRGWSSLEELIIPNAAVTERGIAQLTLNRNLRRLDLTGTYLGDGVGDVLQAFPKLTSLGLGDTDITPAGIARLPRFADLTYLDLSGTLADDGIVNSLAHYPRLSAIDLGRTRVTDFTGQTIAQWSLKDVRLNETAITDKTIDAFVEMETLEHLDIRRSKVTLFGVRRLHTHPNNSLAVRMNDAYLLGKNQLRSLAGKRSTAVNHWNISNDLEPREWRLIASLPGVAALTLQGSNCDDDVLEILATIPTLKQIDLTGCKVSKRGLAALARLPSLEWVTLSKTSVTSDDLTPFREHPKMARMSIDETRVDDQVVPILLSMPVLNGIAISKSQMNYEAANQLYRQGISLQVDGRHWGRIRSDLPRHAFPTPNETDSEFDDDKWLAYFGQLRPDLRTLRLRGAGITDNGMERLSARQSLESLTLIDTSVTADGLRHLAVLPKLELLTLVGEIESKALRKGIAPLRRLKFLKFNGNGYYKEQFAFLREEPDVLATYVDFCGPVFDDEILAQLADFVWLRNANLRDSSAGDATARVLGQLTDLREINLAGTRVTDDGLRQLTPCVHLQRLDLSRTDVTDLGLKHLERLPQLRSIDVRGTKVSPDAIRSLQASHPWIKIESDASW